jgi:hypothetical protein
LPLREEAGRWDINPKSIGKGVEPPPVVFGGVARWVDVIVVVGGAYQDALGSGTR